MVIWWNGKPTMNPYNKHVIWRDSTTCPTKLRIQEKCWQLASWPAWYLLAPGAACAEPRMFSATDRLLVVQKWEIRFYKQDKTRQYFVQIASYLQCFVPQLRRHVTTLSHIRCTCMNPRITKIVQTSLIRWVSYKNICGKIRIWVKTGNPKNCLILENIPIPICGPLVNSKPHTPYIFHHLPSPVFSWGYQPLATFWRPGAESTCCCMFASPEGPALQTQQ